MRRLLDTLHPGDVLDAACGTGRCPGFIRLHSHQTSEYATAALTAGLVIRAYEEPTLTAAAAATPTADLIPEANQDAYVGLPGVLVWAFERPA